MSWFRIEGRMPQHRKVAPLSDAAFRLHITAGAWSAEEGTDGLVPPLVVGTLTAAPHGKKMLPVIQELVGGGLWEQTERGYQIHDYLQWNMSAADLAARRGAKVAAGHVGGRRSGAQRRSKPEADASLLLKQNGSNGEAKPKPSPDPSPDPDPEDLRTDPKDLTGFAGDGVPESLGRSMDLLMNPEETLLDGPLLRQRAQEPGNAVDHLTKTLKVPRAVIVAELEDFCRYREAGAGMGDRRRLWLAHFRQQILNRAKRGELKAIGLVEHEANAEARAAVRKVKTVSELEQEALDARS